MAVPTQDKTLTELVLTQTRFLKSTIQKINYAEDTIDIIIQGGGWTGSGNLTSVDGVELSYQCQEAESAGDPEYDQMSAFREGDSVLVEWTGTEIGAAPPMVEDLRIIGFADGFPRACRPMHLVAIAYQEYVVFYDCALNRCYVPPTWPAFVVSEIFTGGSGHEEWIYFKLTSAFYTEYFMGVILDGIPEKATDEAVDEVDATIHAISNSVADTESCTYGDSCRSSESAPILIEDGVRKITRVPKAFSVTAAYAGWKYDDYLGSWWNDIPNDQGVSVGAHWLPPDDYEIILDVTLYGYTLEYEPEIGSGIVISPPNGWTDEKLQYHQNAKKEPELNTQAFEPVWCWGTGGPTLEIYEAHAYVGHGDFPAIDGTLPWLYHFQCEGEENVSHSSHPRGYSGNTTTYVYHGITRNASIDGNYSNWQRHGIPYCGNAADEDLVTLPGWPELASVPILSKVSHPTEENVNITRGMFINRSNGTAGYLVGTRRGSDWNWGVESGFGVDYDYFRSYDYPVPYRGEFYTYGQFVLDIENVTSAATPPEFTPSGEETYDRWQWLAAHVTNVLLTLKGKGYSTERTVYHNLSNQGEYEHNHDLVRRTVKAERYVHSPLTGETRDYGSGKPKNIRSYDLEAHGTEEGNMFWDHGIPSDTKRRINGITQTDVFHAVEEYETEISKDYHGGSSVWIQGRLMPEALLVIEVRNAFDNLWDGSEDPIEEEVSFHAATRPAGTSEDDEWAEGNVTHTCADWMAEFFIRIRGTSSLSMQDWIDHRLRGGMLGIWYPR